MAKPLLGAFTSLRYYTQLCRFPLTNFYHSLLRRLSRNNPELTEYGAVIFDEFHERNPHIDLGPALRNDSRPGLREDLKVIVKGIVKVIMKVIVKVVVKVVVKVIVKGIVTSATLDGSTVTKVLDDAPILTNEDRGYPVMIRHQAFNHSFARQRRAFLEEVTQRVRNALKEELGNVPVFLHGTAENHQMHADLQEVLPVNISGNDIFPFR